MKVKVISGPRELIGLTLEVYGEAVEHYYCHYTLNGFQELTTVIRKEFCEAIE